MNLEWLPLPPLTMVTLVVPGIVAVVVSFLDGTLGKNKAPRETLRRTPQPRVYHGSLDVESVPSAGDHVPVTRERVATAVDTDVTENEVGAELR